MIEKLTERQEALIPKYVDAWIGDASVNKATQEELENATHAVYRLADIKAEPEVVIVDSPAASIKLAREKGVTNTSDLTPYVLIWWRVNVAYWRFAKYIGVDLKGDIDALAFLCRHADTILAYDEMAILSRKPLEVHWNNRQLHRDGGPAVRYADGYCLYCLNGVRVPRELAETPASELDAKMLVTERNAEIRREIVRKLGIERIYDQLGGTVLDTQGDYEVVELTAIETPGRDDKPRYLKMKNPSIGVWHMEGVLPTISTVEEALSWRNRTSARPDVLT
jgi:hypothetical protein